MFAKARAGKAKSRVCTTMEEEAEAFRRKLPCAVKRLVLIRHAESEVITHARITGSIPHSSDSTHPAHVHTKTQT